MQVSVLELVQAFGRSYRTIDVRTAAIKREASRVNALTVVRVSREEPEVIARKHKQLEQESLRVETEHFRVFLKALEFAKWQDFCSDASKGLLQLDGQPIDLGSLLNLTCLIRERTIRGEVESFCAPLRQVAPGWRRL